MARNLGVFFLAGVILFSETLFFHAAKYVLDYALAMTVVGSAVAGIGVGAFLAGRLVRFENRLFGWCCAGTTASLYLAAFVLLRCAHLIVLLPAVAAVFVFPSIYLAMAFSRRPPGGVYLCDMLGAGCAVALVVLAYEWANTETIFLFLATLLPAAGALWTALAARDQAWRRALSCLWLLMLAAIGGTLLVHQARYDALNIARLVNPHSPNIPRQSALCRPSRETITRSYDSLVGRVDVMPAADRVFVIYDGFFNDNFKNTPAYDYLEYAKPHKIRFPIMDRRVVYGLVPEPRVFVIGSAAPGILKTLRGITPRDRIDAVEINPGILRVMQQDFHDASGRAYEGLRTIEGNALSVLRRSSEPYDIITLINAHSSRWIGSFGPPDYLHTRESYDLYFDHLTENGYLLFEERPDTRRGELGLKRMILTLYDCLKRRGAEDPADHFFIWEFMSRRHWEQGRTGIATGSDMYYVGMVVSREPIVGQRREDLLEWYQTPWTVRWEEGRRPVFVPWHRLMEAAYLKSTWHGERFGPFFDMLRSGDFSALGADFDASVVTKDRPFPSCGTRSVPEIERLIGVTAGVNVILVALFAAGAMRGVQRKRRISVLVVYNGAIGSDVFLRFDVQLRARGGREVTRL